MRVLLQRVRTAKVTIAGTTVGEIGQGLALLVAIAPTDSTAELQWMANKCLHLRLFPDPEHPETSWQSSVQDIGGAILVVSQFTLYGDCRRGRRPSFSGSAAPEVARSRYAEFVELLRQSGLNVATGQFGAQMQVQVVNEGPVTLWLEREAQLD